MSRERLRHCCNIPISLKLSWLGGELERNGLITTVVGNKCKLALVPTNAELVKITDHEFNCSVCGDFKVEIVSHTEGLWNLIRSDFADHVRRRHSNEASGRVDAEST
jgi:hypothetical protein